MKSIWIGCFAATVAFAQMQMQPQYASPVATTTVAFGDKQVRINYHAPSMHGRDIFGGLVPYGKIWRAGANQATLLHTELDLTLGTLAVPKGDYSLYILPEADQWTLIVNKQTGQWGINHDGSTTDDPAQELGRVVVKLSKQTTPVEAWTIALAKDGNLGTLTFSWAGTIATVPFTAK
jgi:hypothetical protein